MNMSSLELMVSPMLSYFDIISIQITLQCAIYASCSTGLDFFFKYTRREYDDAFFGKVMNGKNKY